MNCRAMSIGRAALGAVAVALTLTSCEWRQGESYRYRVTVEVDTPQGLRSGSSVWETNAIEGSGVPDTALRYKGKGEAVAVDLPGGTLFALMRNESAGVDYPHNLVTKHLSAYPHPAVRMSDNWRETRRAIKAGQPSFELYPEEFPLLVRFRDINDPASVQKVDPASLATTFGSQASVRRIWISVTSDPVLTGIEKRFTWWKKYKDRHFNGTSTISEDMTNDALAAHLSSGSFSTEFSK